MKTTTFGACIIAALGIGGPIAVAADALTLGASGPAVSPFTDALRESVRNGETNPDLFQTTIDLNASHYCETMGFRNRGGFGYSCLLQGVPLPSVVTEFDGEDVRWAPCTECSCFFTRIHCFNANGGAFPAPQLFRPPPPVRFR